MQSVFYTRKQITTPNEASIKDIHAKYLVFFNGLTFENQERI